MKLFCLIFVIVIVFLSGEFGTIEQSQGAAPLKLGISLSLTGNTSRTALGQAIWNGLQFWEDWYAANGTALTINGSDYTLELDVRDDQGDAGLMVANYHDLLNSSVAFLGPVNSDFSCILTPLFDSAKTMLLTSAAADQCSLGTDTFFSQLTPGSSTFKSAMLQSRLAGAKSFAWIAETQSYLQSACGALTTIGPESGMGLPVCNISVPGSTDAVITPERIAAWQQAMDQMATPECQADVLVLCMYPPAATVAIDRAKAINFSPKQITVTPLLTAYDSYANNLYLSGSTQWYQGVNFPADPYYGTPQQFLAAYQAKWGYAPDSFDAFGAEAPLVMMNALATASDLSTESISFALSRVDVSTFYGRVVFDARHGNLIDTVVIQYQPSGKNVVGPARAQTNDLIYPMPTWDEREPGYGWMVYSGDIVMAVIDGVCILFSLIMMVVVIAARNTDVFRAAQVEFVLITLLGSILVYLSIYTWLFYVTDASCMALPWLLATGFSMMFCALFAKTWRIHRVFNNPKLRSVKVTSWQIFGIIFADLALIWGLLIPWTIVDPLQQEIVKPDPYRPSQDYTVCAMGSVGTAFLITILVLQGVLLVIGAGMAFLIRNVKLALFNEAKYLGFCIYNMLVISAILVGLVAGSVGSNVDQFWIRVILITIAPLLVVGCLMIPKLFFLRSGANRRTATSSHPSHSGSNGPTRMTSGTFSSSPMPDSEEVNLLRAENAELRAEINQLRAAAAK